METTPRHPRNVVRWRRGALEHAGVPRGLAERLAREPGVDLHALIGLVERGCPPETAARILWPLRGPAARP
ncbi:hypothetical protein [Miltoncostaea marina]|uniref:hypothetical protein n=1 Tax=Miltoncostaea marina TaxID=2843215 RepID=UPI001C3C80F4|nr:hypothetical protein [Miltoncostaea marina]